MSGLNLLRSVPDSSALQCIPEAIAREHQWFAYHFDKSQRQLCVAVHRVPGKLMQQQAQLLLNESVQSETGWTLQWNLIDSDECLALSIQRAYAESYDLDEISASFAVSTDTECTQTDDDQWPIGRWFDALINDAVHCRASDVHAQVSGPQFVIRYRIDGIIRNRTQLPSRFWRHLVARIKVLAQLDLTEHRRPQEGGFELIIHGLVQPIRVGFMPCGRTEKITLRLQRSHHALPALDKLFVLTTQRQLLLDALQRQQGLILVAGATGSGKTTTLYSCLMEWMAMGLNLITLEDPIEVTLSGVCQSPINSEIGYTFSAALRAALRHDPDGLLVGEIRDEETCALAIRAALSGHPVLASVHAGDVIGVVKRLMGLGATLLDLQETVQIIVVQRLARTPCSCEGLLESCVRCFGVGYFGRVAAAEIAPIHATLFEPSSNWELIRKKHLTNYLATLQQLLNQKYIDKSEYERIALTLDANERRQGCRSFA